MITHWRKKFLEINLLNTDIFVFFKIKLSLIQDEKIAFLALLDKLAPTVETKGSRQRCICNGHLKTGIPRCTENNSRTKRIQLQQNVTLLVDFVALIEYSITELKYVTVFF